MNWSRLRKVNGYKDTKDKLHNGKKNTSDHTYGIWTNDTFLPIGIRTLVFFQALNYTLFYYFSLLTYCQRLVEKYVNWRHWKITKNIYKKIFAEWSLLFSWKQKKIRVNWRQLVVLKVIFMFSSFFFVNVEMNLSLF